MTTITYRNGIMAGDTQVYHDALVGHAPKVHVFGNVLVGCTGANCRIRAFVAWVEAGMAGEAPGMAETTALVVMPTGEVRMYGEEGWCTFEAPYYAIGSGKKFALGAMAHGADAPQAVAAAMVHDESTGGTIHCVELERQALTQAA